MVRPALASALFVALAACGDGEAPGSRWIAGEGTGPRVRFDFFAEPLPEVPLPNDVGTWPDPTSVTGRRLNVALAAPTRIEERARSLFGELTGWGTFTTISVSFDAPIDVRALVETFRDSDGRSDFDFSDDALYVVDLETGVPVPLDVCDGNFPIVLEDPGRYYPNDPRGMTSNIVFETVEEDLDGDGVLDAGEDTDFDGVLDHPNVLDWNGDGTLDPDRELLTCWESETNTLLVRPLVPLREEAEHAVILTERLRGVEGEPVRAPEGFMYRHHVDQTSRVDALAAHVSGRPNLYGGLSMDADRAAETEVAFAWTFTTQSVTRELRDLREGLYGRGPFSALASAVPAELTLHEAVGVEFATDEHCPEGLDPDDPEGFNLHIVPIEQILGALDAFGAEVFGVEQEVLDRLFASLRYIDYLALGIYETPFLVAEDKEHDTVDAHFRLNPVTGEVAVGRDVVNVWIAIPKRLAGAEPPFPVAIYGHGYTGPAYEMLGFAGNLAKFGLASIGVQSVGHGMGMSSGTRELAQGMFDVGCAYPLGVSTFIDRSRDLNRDGLPDSGAEFWTAYTFHTRDVVRQTIVDWMQLVRILRTFDGERVGAQDFDADGEPELAGDFDADGIVDLGGPDGEYYAWGQSLGGIESMIAGAAEPAMAAAAPVSGSGGLVDVAIRSVQGGVKEAVVLRVMGPLVLGFAPGTYPPPSEADVEGDPLCVDEGDTRDVYGVSRCAEGQSSLRFVVPDLNDTADVEFGCTQNLAVGNVVVVTNANGEVRCAAVEATGGLRIGIPSDAGDPLDLAIYGPGAVADYGTCALGEDAELVERVSSFTVQGCFHGEPFLAGEALRSIAAGFGLKRGTPDLRRFLMLAELALEPGDPASYARGYFIEPIDYGDETGPTNLLNIGTIGDMNVPINTSGAFGRAAGLIPFISSESEFEPNDLGALGDDVFPDSLRPYLSTPELEATYDGRTPNQVLLDTFVHEGLERLERYASHPTNPGVLFDPDDLDDDTDAYDAPRLRDQNRPPLRLHRVIDGVGTSAQCYAYIDADGEHGFYLSNLDNPFDVDEYMVNLIGRYFQTGGREVYYVVDPEGHHCLEDDSCEFIPPLPE